MKISKKDFPERRGRLAMIEIVSVQNMRTSDAATIESGITGRELMLRAGEAIFRAVDWKSPVAIVCGTGNNAGDGYVLAGLLREAGMECTLILLEDRFSQDGRYYFEECIRTDTKSNLDKVETEESQNWQIKVKYLEDCKSLSGFGTVVDCIFGTGFHGEVKGKAKEAVEKINSSDAYVVAVDINSGLNGDSGMCGKSELECSCVRSDITVSIGNFKPGHFLNMAKDVMRHKVNCDIGIRPVQKPYYLIEEKDIKAYFSERPNFSNKGTYGYTAIIGGSKKYSGALRLAAMANAAMRSGAGVVKVGMPNSLYHDLIPLILESTLFPLTDNDGELLFRECELKELVSNVRTVAFGMGIGQSVETGRCLEYLLKEYSGNMIVDADGLNLLAKMDRELIRRARGKLVLTPHIKEFERLTGLPKDEILNAPIKNAETYAMDTGAIVLLKGPSTIVTDGVRTYLVDSGCSGMATAGSGDVLSGILSAVCSYLPSTNINHMDGSAIDLTLAVAAGAYINGKAGELAQEKYGSISMIASDTVASIPGIIRNLSSGTKQV